VIAPLRSARGPPPYPRRPRLAAAIERAVVIALSAAITARTQTPSLWPAPTSRSG